MTDKEKQELYENICNDISCGTYNLAPQYVDKLLAKLEKENAELKGLKDVATLIRANNDTVITLMQLNNKLVSKNQQLTKAKELLGKLLVYLKCQVLIADKPIMQKDITEAEQFLKDSEVEK